MLDHTDNLVQSFQLESSHLRGRLVRLGSVLDIILNQHAYPEKIGHLLAEAIAVGTALASALKYDGVFTLQAKGDGVVRMLVVDITSNGGIRAYAQFDKDRLADAEHGDARLLGKGYLAFTCALTGKEDRYQGIVALEGYGLAEAVQHYFRQSEQIPTGIMVAAYRDAHGRWRAGCLLIQRMPREGGINIENHTPEVEDWTRAMMVMGTLTAQELTDAALLAENLLFRLFHEEGVRVFEPLQLRHQCRCSQTRVENMLRSLPQAEVEDMVVGDKVTVTCEFCNKSYPFDAEDRRKLWAEIAI
jgi:molecular chaperone Hsp33